MFCWFLVSGILLFTVPGVSTSVNNDICERGHLKMDGACFLFGPRGKTWAEAEQFCKSRSTHLARLDSVEKHNALNAYMSREFSLQEVFWVDLKRFGSDYVHTSNDSPMNQTFWNQDRPRGKTCVAKKGSGWDDLGCTWPMSYICESAECPSGCQESEPKDETLDVDVEQCSNGAKRIDEDCFFIQTSETASRLDANAACEQKSGRLARMNTEEKYQQLEKYLKAKTLVSWIYYWIPGRRVDGSEDFFDSGVLINGTRWGEDEPNDKDGVEDCIQQRFSPTKDQFEWTDVRCDLELNYICELTECPADCEDKPDPAVIKTTTAPVTEATKAIVITDGSPSKEDKDPLITSLNSSVTFPRSAGSLCHMPIFRLLSVFLLSWPYRML